MGENWNVSVISFENDDNVIEDNWHPIYRDSLYRFDFADLTQNLTFFNGNHYNISDEKLSSYGGRGYGTFESKDITRISDTISIVATSCTGHCGIDAEKITYSKNIFTKQGRLKSTIFYPDSDKELEDREYAPYNASIEDYDKFFDYLIKESHRKPDTLYYKYNQNGNFSNSNKEINLTDFDQLFNNDYSSNYIFHQCYVGNVKMEKFFREKVGFTPKLIVIEIYKYGVFSFRLNSKNQKYYEDQTIILEQ